MYSPIMPSSIIWIPPISRMLATVDVHPTDTDGLLSLDMTRKDNNDESYERKQHSQEISQTKRLDGECRYSVEPQIEQLLECIAGLACKTALLFDFNIPYPSCRPQQKTCDIRIRIVVFCHLERNESLRDKVYRGIDVLRLFKKVYRHLIVDPAAESPEQASLPLSTYLAQTTS